MQKGVWVVGVLLGIGALFSNGSILASPVTLSKHSAAPQAQSRSHERDALTALGLTVTQGAAPGYIEDRACAICHKKEAESYQSVGMSRSFYRPRPEVRVEDFANSHFFHEPSQRHYEMHEKNGQLFFKRYQLDANHKPINVIERQVDWIMGSGSTSRSYIYQTVGGELYQLPIAWYTQTKHWGIAPGFDRPDHQGIQRRVNHECMFCHNAYPNIPQGNDRLFAQPAFPTNLPEGIGCQRCHGPGAEHSRLAFEAKLPRQKLNASIVNPARLDPQLRNDVCLECHMQPSVTINRPRRFDQPVYSYRPGKSLSDHMVMMDVREKGKPKSERFEINHHPYRLQQSRCYQESQGALSCLTCHDPHRKAPVEERSAHYRAACLGCHPLEHCSKDSSHSQQTATSRAAHQAAYISSEDGGDCISCHMPRRRTQDVVHVVMTDHRIQRRPRPKAERLAPLHEERSVVKRFSLFDPQRAPAEPLGRLYRVFADAHMFPSPFTVQRLQRSLTALPQTQLDPYLVLARGQLGLNRYADAEETLSGLLQQEPTHAFGLQLLGFGSARPREIRSGATIF